MRNKTNSGLAIELIKEQVAKIEHEGGGGNADDAWIAATQSLMRKLYGKDSDEYEYFKAFTFGDNANPQQFGAKIWEAQKYLNGRLDNIRAYGLPALPRTNFLYRIKEGWLICWISLAITALIATGKLISDLQNVELNQKLTKQEAEIQQLKNSTSKTVEDTVLQKAFSPTKRSLQPKSKPISQIVTQSNQSEKNEANINNGTNNGIIGGDHNSIINEKKLSEKQKKDIVTKISLLGQEHGKTFYVTMWTKTGASSQMATQISEFLKTEGYLVRFAGTISMVVGDDIKAYQITANSESIAIIAGEL